MLDYFDKCFFYPIRDIWRRGKLVDKNGKVTNKL